VGRLARGRGLALDALAPPHPARSDADGLFARVLAEAKPRSTRYNPMPTGDVARGGRAHCPATQLAGKPDGCARYFCLLAGAV
jgi:hypothetical protein